MTQPTIRILLIDDHTLVRQGLRSLLDPDPEFQVVGEASTGADALALARRVQADVAIVDIRLPDMDGPSVCQSLRNMQPRIAILVLSAYMDSSLVSASLKAGARGYLLKDAENLHLKDQIRSVYQGYSAYDPRTANIVTQLALGHNPQEGGLKPREMEILRCMAQGMTNRDIAARLQLSEYTVKDYVKEILHKMNAHNRVEAVMNAKEQGLL